MQTPGGSGRCRSKNNIHAGDTHIQARLDNPIDQVYSMEHKALLPPHNNLEDENLSGSGRKDGF